MASSRETLIFLITEKTDMDIAQASAYVSKIIEDIDEKSVEPFLKGMVVTVGRSDIDKIDAVSLDSMVQGIISRQNVFTKKEILVNKREAEERQAREDKFVDEYIEASKDQTSQDETKENQNVLADYEKGLSLIPEEYRKVNEYNLRRILELLSQEMPGAEEEDVKAAATAVEVAERKEELKKELIDTKGPEEAEKAVVALETENLLKDVCGKEEPSEALKLATYKAVKKGYKEDERQEDKSKNPDYDFNEAAIISRINKVKSTIAEMKKMQERDPNNRHYAEEITKLEYRLNRIKNGLESYREGKTKKEGFLGPQKAVKDTISRRKDIEKGLDKSSTRIKELSAMYRAETDPEKKEKIRLELVQEGAYAKKQRTQMAFESVHGKYLDMFLTQEMKNKKNKGEFNVDMAIEKFKKRLISSDEVPMKVQNLREQLKSPNITSSKRIDLLVEMANLQESYIENLGLLGYSRDHVMNLSQKNGPLTSMEWLEVEEYRIKNDSKVNNDLKERQIHSVQLIRDNIELFENNIQKLQEKGYSENDMALFLNTLQRIRGTQESTNGLWKNKAVFKEEFVDKVSTRLSQTSYGKKITQMASEFADLYEGNEESLITLSVSSYNAIVQSISAQREMFLDKSKAKQLTGITKDVSQQEMGEVTAGIKEDSTKGVSQTNDSNETQTQGVIEIE